MIHEVDAAVRALIKRDAINGDDVEVVFDAPTRDWSSKRSSPTVDVFLFDIREDLKRRRVEPEPVRDDEGMVLGRRRPPRRYRLSYLVTAWTQRAEDEHRLLSAVLHAFLSHDELPRDLLVGDLAEQPQPVYLTVGLPPPPERSIGEIWSAMGGELKPSVELVVSAPFVMAELQPAGPPVQEEPRFTFEDRTGRAEAPSSRSARPPGGSRASPGREGEALETEETVSGGRESHEGRRFTISTRRARR